MISTSMNFIAIGIKLVLVEIIISKFILVEFSLCTTQLVQILHRTIFSKSQKSYYAGTSCTSFFGSFIKKQIFLTFIVMFEIINVGP